MPQRWPPGAADAGTVGDVGAGRLREGATVTPAAQMRRSWGLGGWDGPRRGGGGRVRV